ncbi:hypothetical protein FHW66_002346 [Herbaspirillum sp. Sphag64]|uniref:hypothetical protein n=1 Tax=Herbaspirillum sp. Sphag1AN TaxID=2587030 RepID=UPI0017D41EB8|nr:hypothetical protein [Herbaspirillum sp. Sphag1AN]MBB3246255.1 hypothetical protein [Herbaspirillum sp. Sphag64]
MLPLKVLLLLVMMMAQAWSDVGHHYFREKMDGPLNDKSVIALSSVETGCDARP